MGELTHTELVERAVHWLYGRWRCYYVMAETAKVAEQPDAIGWTNRGSLLIECKCSIGDFYVDRRKPWRLGCGLGIYRWYLTPPGLLRVDQLPALWGLAECHADQIRIFQRARRVPLSWWSGLSELCLLAKSARAEQVYSGNCLCGCRQNGTEAQERIHE